MSASTYPHLRQLFGGYFNQDEVTDAAGWPELAAAYRGSQPWSAVEGAVGELSRLLADPRFERSPDAVLGELGCDYAPAADRLSAAEWVAELRDHLAGALGRQG